MKKMAQSDFHKICYLQALKDNAELRVIISQKDEEIKDLKIKGHNLELQLMKLKTSHLRQIETKKEIDLTKYRNEVAEKLNIKNLDDWLIDDETYELKHLKEFENNSKDSTNHIETTKPKNN